MSVLSTVHKKEPSGCKLPGARLLSMINMMERYQLELTQRVAQVKNSSGPVAFILCGPCKKHSEKEVSRKNNEGKGYGVRVVRTRIMVPSGSFRYTRFW